MLEKTLEELEIALFGIAELFRSAARAETFTAAFKKHRELEGEFIIGIDREHPCGTGQERRLRRRGEFDHRNGE
ncbi:MAG: hypothetical protein PHV34_05380 [Verrucomicrobiae bacterium]|nr:hypothetical protein [Verrucomicrobiae bacterium]